MSAVDEFFAGVAVAQREVGARQAVDLEAMWKLTVRCGAKNSKCTTPATVLVHVFPCGCEWPSCEPHARRTQRVVASASDYSDDTPDGRLVSLNCCGVPVPISNITVELGGL